MIELLHKPAAEYLAGFPDKSIDLVCIDPPFDFRSGGGDFNKADYMKKIYKTKINKGFDLQLLNELARIQPVINAYIFCNMGLLLKLIDFYKDRGLILDILVWHKTGAPPYCAQSYLADFEYILFVKDPQSKMYNNYNSSSKLFKTSIASNKNKLIHPTSKPVDLLLRLITNSSAPGDSVLDFFSGSGSTALACAESGRNFFGCEINKEYHAESLHRIKNRQGVLFNI